MSQSSTTLTIHTFLSLQTDKNPDNLEEVKAKFLEVQQAYEVLIDPQERAWYDKHREAILKGGLGHGDDYKDDAVNVFAYFNTSCYKGRWTRIFSDVVATCAVIG